MNILDNNNNNNNNNNMYLKSKIQRIKIQVLWTIYSTCKMKSP